jgi:hypothetical protein
MSTSALPFLDGLARRSRRSQKQQGHERRDTTDAYLNRSSVSAFGWTEALTRQVQR